MTMTLHIGASGMGKTYSLARVVEAHALRPDNPWTCVVVDAKQEWSRHSPHGTLVSGPKGASEAVKRGARIIVWTGGGGVGQPPDVNAACEWCLENGHGTLLAVPEAHLHWRLGAQPSPASVEVLTGYRHRGLAVILDTQRVASLSMMARNNLDMARIFGVTGKRDLDELRQWGGSELEDAARECARLRRLPPDGKGEAGWFVPYDAACSVGPYKMERFS